jgi:hypothetical protein
VPASNVTAANIKAKALIIIFLVGQNRFHGETGHNWGHFASNEPVSARFSQVSVTEITPPRQAMAAMSLGPFDETRWE